MSRTSCFDQDDRRADYERDLAKHEWRPGDPEPTDQKTPGQKPMPAKPERSA